MAFTLPDLPYAHDALAALGMSKETFEYHHDIHHKAYVDNGNKLIAGTEWEAKSVEEIVVGTYNKTAVAQSGIFNNASQHWNHAQFWQMMGPGGKAMPGALDKALAEAFGSVAKFKEDFAAAGAGQFGSGWAWLVKKDDGLAIEQSSNADTPFATDKTCVLTIDVWEHAYYVDYRNARPKYIEEFWKVVNWDFASSNLVTAG